MLRPGPPDSASRARGTPGFGLAVRALRQRLVRARILQDRGGGAAQHPLRRGRPHRPSLLGDAGADRGDREGIAAAEVAVRRAAGAVLPAQPRALRGAGGSLHGDRRLDGRRARAAARATAPALLAAGRGPATRCCGCSTPSEAEPAPPTTCSATTWRCSTPIRRGERAGRGARLPAEAGAGGRLLAGAGELRALRRGRAPDRVLGRRGRGGLRELRGRRLPALRGGPPVHGRGAGAGRWRRRRWPSGAVAAQADRAVTETLEHHAHVHLRAAA